MKSLSGPVIQVLKHLAAGEAPGHHCRGRSEFGGLTTTVHALFRRGLVTRDVTITDAGRAALESPPAKVRRPADRP